jgi:hypothetical protein
MSSAYWECTMLSLRMTVLEHCDYTSTAATGTATLYPAHTYTCPIPASQRSCAVLSATAIFYNEPKPPVEWRLLNLARFNSLAVAALVLYILSQHLFLCRLSRGSAAALRSRLTTGSSTAVFRSHSPPQRYADGSTPRPTSCTLTARLTLHPYAHNTARTSRCYPTIYTEALCAMYRVHIVAGMAVA